MTAFFRNWLTIWCLAVVLFGILLTGGAFAETDGPVRAMMALLNPAAGIAMSETLRFSLALMGAVTIGWALTLFAAFRAAERLGTEGAPIWRLLTLAMTGWYTIDSSLSVATGFGLNAVSNTVLFAAFLWPVWHSGVLGGGALPSRV